MNEIISDGGVYRTAPPTRGLLSISQKTGLKKVLYCFWFLAGYFNISEKKKKRKKHNMIANFSSNHSLDLYLPRSVGVYKFLNLFHVIL